jgi:PAS domain S-box-containing protein
MTTRAPLEGARMSAMERALATLTLSGGRRNWIKVFLAVAAVLVYGLAFIPPYRFQEMGIVELIAMPVLVAAWIFGFWAGLLAAMVSIPLNAFLLTAVGQPGWALLAQTQTLSGSILVLVLGAVFGGLRDLGELMQSEFAARKRVELARDQSEERYRLVAEGASDAVFTLDEGGRIIFANPAAVTIFGYPMEELRDRPFTILLPEEDRPARRATMTQHLDQLIEGSGRQTLELRGQDKSGLPIDMEVSFGHQQQGGRHFFTAIVRDVSDRKGVEGMLQDAKEEAERANRAKSEFLSRMSHELRTPLNAILGFGQLLEMDQLESEEQRESVDHIMKAGRHLLALVDEVLDIARIEAGKLAITIEPVSVREVLDEAWDLVRPRAAQRNVQRAGDGRVCQRYVRADRQRLKQVLLNLVSNAVKYTPEGSVVRLSCDEQPGGRLRINVRDNGRGIPLEKQALLFKPFERLGAEASGIEGTGIGLALSKGLVEAMDGTIGVTSMVGDGATFWVELPLDPDAIAKDSAIASNGAGEAHVDGGPRTILYIEDNPSNFELVKRILVRNSAFRLLSAAIQGGLGLELAAEHKPDLILLDLNLPDMSGEDVLRRLRADPEVAQIPVVVITAGASKGQREKLLATGADAYLAKPLDVEQFLKTIDDVVMTRR